MPTVKKYSRKKVFRMPPFRKYWKKKVYCMCPVFTKKAHRINLWANVEIKNLSQL